MPRRSTAKQRYSDNPIVSGWPSYLVYEDGTRKPCDAHFRVWLQIARLYDDPVIPDMEKAARAIQLSGIEPGDPQADLDAISVFLMAGAEPGRRKDGPRTFDFDVDAALIAASFEQVYGIDVTARECDMHWWRFMALLRGMGETAPIMRATAIRTMDVPEGNDRQSQKRREAVMEAKRRLQLPAKSATDKIAREKLLWGE